VILGASFDTPEDNRTFAEQNGMPFRLMGDPERKVGPMYEVQRAPAEPSPEFAKRRTYLIDPHGTIVKAYRVRDIPAHPDEVLTDLRALQAARA
jgi:thioredoxin-dependent peroxiredoxin